MHLLQFWLLAPFGIHFPHIWVGVELVAGVGLGWLCPGWERE